MDNYFNMNPDPIKDTDSKSEICIEEGSDVDDIQSSERKKTGGRETLEMILGNFLNPSQLAHLEQKVFKPKAFDEDVSNRGSFIGKPIVNSGGKIALQ